MRVWGSVLVAVVAVGACAGETIEGGSETNWLASCNSDADCAVGQCVCGVCSAACVAGASCSTGGGLDTCAAQGSTAFAEACGATSSATGICLRGCADGATCDAGERCVEGACVPEQRGTGGAIASADGGGTATASGYFAYTDDLSFLWSSTQPLHGKCMSRALPLDGAGHVACTVVQATPRSSACECSVPGRATPNLSLSASTLSWLRESGRCDAGADTPSCSELCLCELEQLSGTALQSCREDMRVQSGVEGWCYMAPGAGPLNPDLGSWCDGRGRLLRIAATFSTITRTELVLHCETAASTAPAAATGTPGAIGDTCVLGDELRPDFPGYAAGEVNVETGTPVCASGVCLAHHFQGRPHCAFGQPSDSSDPTRVDPAKQTCFTPGENPEPVTVPVPAQLVARQVANAVYCSCRCDGEGPGPFCACPTGFECAPLVQDFGFGNASEAGSYCIKQGTAVTDPVGLSRGATCVAGDPNCDTPGAVCSNGETKHVDCNACTCVSGEWACDTAACP